MRTPRADTYETPAFKELHPGAPPSPPERGRAAGEAVRHPLPCIVIKHNSVASAPRWAGRGTKQRPYQEMCPLAHRREQAVVVRKPLGVMDNAALSCEQSQHRRAQAPPCQCMHQRTRQQK